MQDNGALGTSVKVERPFPSVSASGQTKPHPLCLLTRARAWVQESKESADTMIMGEKNMFEVVRVAGSSRL